MPDQVNIKKSNIWVTLVVALISSGAVGYYFNYKMNDTVRTDAYVEKYVEKVEDCERRISELQQRITILENGLLDLPFPAWIKDTDSKILWINKAYVDMILLPNGYNEYALLGTKGECFGPEFLTIIIENDRTVLSKQKTVAFSEHVPGIGDGVSYKFIIKTRYGSVSGVGGIWIPVEVKKALGEKLLLDKALKEN